MEKARFSWEAPEFEFREKTVSWYWTTIIVAVLILGAAIWQKNFLFGFFVVVAEILILVWGNRKPNMETFALTEKELTIGDRKSYAYSDIYGFAIEDEDEGEWATLIIELNKKLSPAIRINIPKSKIPVIKKIISHFVDEIEVQESLTDTFQKFFRF